MNYLGTFQHSLDSKNRLQLPSIFTEKLGDVIVISKGFEGCIELRNKNEFQEYSSKILSLTETKKDTRDFKRIFFKNSREIEIDAAKRILIPKNLIELANLSKYITIIGVGDKIEI
jgi:MraZ protein